MSATERYRVACDLLIAAEGTADEFYVYLLYAAVMCGLGRSAPN